MGLKASGLQNYRVPPSFLPAFGQDHLPAGMVLWHSMYSRLSLNLQYFQILYLAYYFMYVSSSPRLDGKTLNFMSSCFPRAPMAWKFWVLNSHQFLIYFHKPLYIYPPYSFQNNLWNIQMLSLYIEVFQGSPLPLAWWGTQTGLWCHGDLGLKPSPACNKLCTCPYYVP